MAIIFLFFVGLVILVLVGNCVEGGIEDGDKKE